MTALVMCRIMIGLSCGIVARKGRYCLFASVPPPGLHDCPQLANYSAGIVVSRLVAAHLKYTR